MVYSFAMLPVVIAPYYFGFAGLLYLFSALGMTLYYNYLCLELFKAKITKTSNKITRPVMEMLLKIDKEAELPKFYKKTLIDYFVNC